jgi:beta-N-acetylhexosaminidase
MLSPRILRDLLRAELGFDGVVVTDALDMDALDQSGVLLDAITSVGAGVDLLLAGPKQADRHAEFAAIRRGLVQATLRGLIPPEALRCAAERVLALRRWLDGREQPSLDVVGCPAHQALALEIAARSLTLVRDRAGILPLRPGPSERILVIVPEPTDLTPADTSSFVRIELAEAIRRRHHAVDELVLPIDPSGAEVRAARERAVGFDLVIVGTISALDHPGQADLVQALLGSGVPVASVALRTPYDLGAYPAAPTYLCTYSIQPPSMDALAAGFFGEIPFAGRLPVAVPGAPDADTGQSASGA